MLQHGEFASPRVPSTPTFAPVPAPLGYGPWHGLRTYRPASPGFRVVSQQGGAWYFHDARHISRFFAADKYTCFRLNGTEHLLTESLTSLQKRLKQWGFMRTHRSQLVNLSHVLSVRRQEQSFELHLLDGQRVLVSRRLAAEVRRCLTF